MAKLFEVTLGDEAKDSISGFKGVVVAITEWLYGCRRIVIQPQILDKEGKPFDGQSFDELQVEVTKKNKKAPVTVGSVTSAKNKLQSQFQAEKTGGPRPDFPRR